MLGFFIGEFPIMFLPDVISEPRDRKGNEDGDLGGDNF